MASFVKYHDDLGWWQPSDLALGSGKGTFSGQKDFRNVCSIDPFAPSARPKL